MRRADGITALAPRYIKFSAVTAISAYGPHHIVVKLYCSNYRPSLLDDCHNIIDCDIGVRCCHQYCFADLFIDDAVGRRMNIFIVRPISHSE